ncbi:VirB5 [Pseudomonas savastanoi pv. glycinea]|uniref:VirB5 n=1 Tax=Pseudomonas savastanoi pv. glycinea TaxID=318 RepID=A0ABR5LHE6_PSESG|nr:VirB5 [Pseudomonas savastanoi pv. glycinea]
MKQYLIYFVVALSLNAAALPAFAAVPGVPVLDPSTLLTLRANALAQAKQATTTTRASSPATTCWVVS